LLLQRNEPPAGQALPLVVRRPPGDRAEEHQAIDQFGAASCKRADDDGAPGMRNHRHARHLLALADKAQRRL